MKQNRKLTKVLLMVYLLALTWIILFKLQMDFSNLRDMNYRSVNLIPFAGSGIVNDRVDVSEILLNVAAFVPFGIYVSMLKPDGGFWKKVLPIFCVSLFYAVCSRNRRERYHRPNREHIGRRGRNRCVCWAVPPVWQKDHQNPEHSGDHRNGSRSRVSGTAGHCEPVDSNSGLLASVGILWYSYAKEVLFMDTKDVLYNLRAKKGLSQDELAEKVFVTRQAVSRWENGETTPNVETLKLLSEFYDVSINTLLGSPRQLICQCCGMPLEDSTLSRETDGSFNEEYCKWCYADGEFTYSSKEQLIDFCAKHMASESWPEQQVRAHMEALVPTLKHWK